MSKQVLEQDEEYEEQAAGPNWTLIIVGYFAVLAVVITLLRPLHLTMGGIFFSMVIAGVVLALAIFLVKRSIQAFQAQGITVRQAVKTKYRHAIGYEGLPDEEEEDEERDQAPASFIADRDPLNLGERFKPSFHAFLCATCLIVGLRRSGKSTVLQDLIEELATYNLPFVLFDTMGEFYGLVDKRFLVNPRLGGNVERLRDVPEAAQPFLANLTKDNAYNVGQAAVKHMMQLVVDLKYYDDNTAALIMSEIVDGVNDWQEERANEDRIPFTFAVDEGQKWFPQEKGDRSPDILPDTQAVLDEAFNGTIVARGGKNGLGLIVATQRYSQISKKLLQSQWKFYLRQTEEVDLKRYKEQGIDPDEAKMLQQGECIVQGPDVARFRFRARLGHAPHAGHTPNASALSKYTRELNFNGLQKTGAFIDDMPLERPAREQIGNSQTFPTAGKKSNLSLVQPSRENAGIPDEDIPEDELDEPVERFPNIPEDGSRAFQPGENDSVLSGMQGELFLAYYGSEDSPSRGNVEESLKQVRNEKGQGLGKRYYKHANWILEQRGLKKAKRA